MIMNEPCIQLKKCQRCSNRLRSGDWTTAFNSHYFHIIFQWLCVIYRGQGWKHHPPIRRHASMLKVPSEHLNGYPYLLSKLSSKLKRATRSHWKVFFSHLSRVLLFFYSLPVRVHADLPLYCDVLSCAQPFQYTASVRDALKWQHDRHYYTFSFNHLLHYWHLCDFNLEQHVMHMTQAEVLESWVM